MGDPKLYSCSIDIFCLSLTTYELSDLFILAGISLLCYVLKCELSYNVLGMTQNCIPPSEVIIPNRECVIRLGIGEGANVIFKQVSHTIR